MNATWDDEYLTVNEIAEHLKLNPQTVRNWIDQGALRAVRIGRRVRVPRAEMDRVLAQGTSTTAEPRASAVASDQPDQQLSQALERAQRLLGRRSAVRRVELAQGLQELADAVAATLAPLDPPSPTGQ